MSLFSDSQLNNIIEMRGISQSYDGGETFILQDLDFLVEDKPAQGQFVVILGPSGCGKSTVLRYIAGLQTPTSGNVLLHNKEVTTENRVGMVFQQYSSLPWMTVLDNVALGLQFKGLDKKEREAKAMDMIEKVGLLGHEKKFAQYPTLSGGQLQRVAIARSLMANQEILLMDEPFGALDINTRIQMQDLLAALWADIHPTVIFVTHDISEAVYLGDDIYIMQHAPSRFAEHIKVDLPLRRDRAMKRDPKFTDLVRHVEDRMIAISNQQPQT